MDFHVAPHPRGEAQESWFPPFLSCHLNRLRGALPRAWPAPNISIYMFGVRPVGFDSHDVEAVVLDHVLCDLGAGRVEFGGAVGGVADEQDLALAKAIKVPRYCVAILGNRVERRDVCLEEFDSGRCHPCWLFSRDQTRFDQGSQVFGQHLLCLEAFLGGNSYL